MEKNTLHKAQQVRQLCIGRAYRRTSDQDWDTAILDFLADRLSQLEERTEQYYATQLSVLARWAVAAGVALPDFAARDMRLYLIERANKVSESTRHHDAVCAKVFFRFAAREGYIDRDPLADYKVKRAPTPYARCPTADELRILLESIPRRWDPKQNPGCRSISARRRTFFRLRNLAIIAGLAQTGCRAGELFALEMRDYDPLSRQIGIRTSKTDEPRIVPITANWIGLVNAYLAVRPRKIDCQCLFVGEYGNPIDVGDFGHAFKRQVEFAGLSGITLHRLRHYAASAIVSKDPLAAMGILGHKNLSTTTKYSHARQEQMRAAMDAADPLGAILQNKSSERARRKRLF